MPEWCFTSHSFHDLFIDLLLIYSIAFKYAAYHGLFHTLCHLLMCISIQTVKLAELTSSCTELWMKHPATDAGVATAAHEMLRESICRFGWK